MKFSRLFCRDQDQDFIFFVFEAPRDQDLGLEDYITG